MRPIRLEIKGLNSFIERQEIDFNRLTEGGLFGIFGPTGSGKTTILDGITLALYGKIARKSKNFVNANCDSATVVFDFQISGKSVKRYRVERNFKQDKKTGGFKSGKCSIADITKEVKILADKVTEVNMHCQNIIGLSAEDFQRTVVLPQGKFSEFLKLEGNERSKMLERLFQLEDYGEDLTCKLKEKRDREELQMAEIDGQIKTYGELSMDSLKMKEKEFEILNQKLEEKKEQFNKISKVYEEWKETWTLQQELFQYGERKAVLEKKQAEMTQLKEKISLSERASRVFPFIQSWNKTMEELTRTRLNLGEIKQSLLIIGEEKMKEDALWNAVKENKNDRIPNLQQQVPKLSEAIRLKGELEVLLEEVKKLSQECNVLGEKKEEYHKKITALKMAMEEERETISYWEKQVSAVTIEPDVRIWVRDGLTFEKQIQMLMEQLQEEQCNFLEQEHLAKLNLQELKEIEKKLFPDGEVPDLALFQKELLEKENKWLQYETREQRLSEIGLSMEEKLKKSKDATQLSEKQRKLVEKMEIKIRQAETENLSQKLRKELAEGKPCPVCGAIHHELVSFESYDNEKIKQLYESLDQQREELNRLERDEIAYKSASESLRNQSLDIQKEIEKLGQNFLEHTKPVYQEMSKWLLEYMDKAGRQKARQQEVESVRKAILLKEQKKKELIEEIKKLQIESKISDFQKMSDRIDVLDKKYHETEGKLKELRKTSQRSQESYTSCSDDLAEVSNLMAAKSEAVLQKKQAILEREKLLDGLQAQKKTKEELAKEYSAVVEEINEIEQKYVEIEERKEKSDHEYETAQKKFIELSSQLRLLEERLRQEKIDLDGKLKEEKMDSVDSCRAGIMEKDSLAEGRNTLEKYQNDFMIVSSFIKKTLEKLGDKRTTEEKWQQIQREKSLCQTELEEIKKSHAQMAHQLEEAKEKWNMLKGLLLEREKRAHQMALLDDLFKLFRGKRFVEYVAHSRLKYISQAAGKRLYEISSGNYGLEVDEEGKFVICDYKNGGAKRDASTLSGGETFLVSLSLSLALSEQVQLKGTAPLELFFLDEGFGTLDEKLLDVVMDSLEKIQNERLKVGIISHVEAIKDRVPVKLLVTSSKAGMGGSKIKIEKN